MDARFRVDRTLSLAARPLFFLLANVESLDEKRAAFFAANPHLRPNADG